MVIDGTIVAVLESWPLQLRVETQEGPYLVALLAETTVVDEGKSVEAGTLRVGQRVRLEGEASRPGTLAAHAIWVLPRSPLPA